MRNIPANRSDRDLNGRSPSEPPEPTVRWKMSRRTVRTDGSMGDLLANHLDRWLNGRSPSEPPGPMARCETSQCTARPEGPMGDISARHSGRGPDGRYPREPRGPTARCEISQCAARRRRLDGKYLRALLGSRARWEISAQNIRSGGSMGDFPARYLNRRLDGRYPSALPGPRADGNYPRAPQVEGSVQDFPAGPGVGHSAAPTLPSEVGVFPSPGRRSPTRVLPGGQAANANLTTTQSYRRLTSRQVPGCLRWLAKGTPQPHATHHEPNRNRAA